MRELFEGGGSVQGDTKDNLPISAASAMTSLCARGTESFADSPLEGDGFELPVRGRGQSDCRHFVQPAAFDRVRAAAGWTIGRRAVPSLVVRRQGD